MKKILLLANQLPNNLYSGGLIYLYIQNFCFNAFKDKFNKSVFLKNVSAYFEINN